MSGSLNTNAPTLTRLARGLILCICQMYQWHMFTSNITTTFLQGKNFPKDSDRVIWIRLPRDAKQLLGMTPEEPTLMRLVKPMYGLCDAPRAWYEEATSSDTHWIHAFSWFTGHYLRIKCSTQHTSENWHASLGSMWITWLAVATSVIPISRKSRRS